MKITISIFYFSQQRQQTEQIHSMQEEFKLQQHQHARRLLLCRIL